MKLIKWITSGRLWRCLLGKIIARLRFSNWYSDITGYKYNEGYHLLKPGHILLSVDNKKLLTFIIPGDFSHAAVCVSKGLNGFFEVAEMTEKDYKESYFYDVCHEADRVVILECKDFSPAYTQRFINRCLSFQEAKYDYAFSLGVDALYCSELVYQSDFEHILDVSLEDIHALGTKYISPDGLYKARNVKVIWDSRG